MFYSILKPGAKNTWSFLGNFLSFLPWRPILTATGTENSLHFFLITATAMNNSLECHYTMLWRKGSLQTNLKSIFKYRFWFWKFGRKRFGDETVCTSRLLNFSFKLLLFTFKSQHGPAVLLRPHVSVWALLSVKQSLSAVSETAVQLK